MNQLPRPDNADKEFIEKLHKFHAFSVILRYLICMCLCCRTYTYTCTCTYTFVLACVGMCFQCSNLDGTRQWGSLRASCVADTLAVARRQGASSGPHRNCAQHRPQMRVRPRNTRYSSLHLCLSAFIHLFSPTNGHLFATSS